MMLVTRARRRPAFRVRPVQLQELEAGPGTRLVLGTGPAEVDYAALSVR
jgi:hypothetical protein